MILLTLPRRMACGLFVLSACQPSTQSAEEASAAAQSSSSSDPQNAGNPQDEAPEPGDDLTRNASAACPPPGLFDRALCLCEDLADVGLMAIRAGAGGPGSVGVNGKTHLVNASLVEGRFDAYQSFSAVAAAEIGDTLATTGDASWVGALSVGGDFAVGGDARGVGLLHVDGALRVAGAEGFIGLSAADRAAYEPPAAPPCPCDPSTFFDVQAAVEGARDQNDNASIGLAERLRQVGLRVLTLPAGSYYIEDAATLGVLDIRVTGSVSLYVNGHVDSVGLEHFHLEDAAELDLYVSGGIRSVGLTAAGNRSSKLRIYVGGEAPVLLSVGAQAFYGAIYAPEAQVAYVGDTRIVGSLFARTLHGVGRLVIEEGDSAADPDRCDPPEGSDGGVPGDGSDGGVPVDEQDAGAPDPGEPETPDPGDGDGDGPLL